MAFPLAWSLTVFAGILLLALGVLIGWLIARQRFKEAEKGIREDAVSRSRAVLAGQFSEQLAPYLPGFSWKPTEARFLGKPIDFIVFKGLDERQVEEVVFVEVKTGGSRLNGAEKSLKDAIEQKKVSWAEYRPSNTRES